MKSTSKDVKTNCLLGGGGHQVGEVTRLAGVTCLSVSALVLILSRLHDKWDDHMRDCMDRRVTSSRRVISSAWVPPTP